MRLKVGMTPLQKSIEMCGRCNGATVLVKHESMNPFKTFKDRRCSAILDREMRKLAAKAGACGGKSDGLLFVHITSGNSGFSLGHMAKERVKETGLEIQVVNIVPKGISREVREALEGCSIVVELGLGKRIITQDEMKEIARKATGFDGPEENIVGVEDYGLANGYRTIVREIFDTGVKPDYIFCPVGEGELAVELAEGANEIWGDEAPMVVGVTIAQNTIVKAEEFLKRPGKSIADKLVNGYSKFKELLLNLVKNGRVELVDAISEREIAKEYKYLNKIGIAVEPSAAVAFCGAEKFDLGPSDTVVIVNTGKGNYDQKAVDKLWRRRALRAVKFVAAVALGIAMAYGVSLYRNYIESQNRFLELQRQELVQQVEYEMLDRVVAEATHMADRDNDGRVDSGEFVRMLRMLPGRDGSRPENPGGIYVGDILDLTQEELEYFTEVSRHERHEELEARFRKSYLSGEFQGLPSVMERRLRLERAIAGARQAADEDEDGEISAEEFSRMLKAIPSREIFEVGSPPEKQVRSIEELTQEELELFAEISRLSRYGGNIEMSMRYAAERRFRKRLAIGEIQKLPSVMERRMRISKLRNICHRTEGGGIQSTFREFDVDNPMDPRDENICDW
ncbi:MAG: pyridoxal-phosphate dependent enzyme [Candidatus Micrarchaeota archaeon]